MTHVENFSLSVFYDVMMISIRNGNTQMILLVSVNHLNSPLWLVNFHPHPYILISFHHASISIYICV